MSTDELAIDFPARWYGLVGIYGGFVLARLADAAAVIDGFSVVSLTARFVAPTEQEPATLRRTIIHRGGRTASVRLELEQSGRRTVDATAVLLPVGDEVRERGSLGADRLPPGTEPAADWSPRRHVQGDLAFLQNLEVRTPARFTTAEGSTAWLRLTGDDARDDLVTPHAVACALMDTLLPVPFGGDPPPHFVPTIEFAVHFTPLIGRVLDGWVYGRNLLEWRTEQYCVEDATLTTATGELLARQRQARLIIP